MPKMHYSRLHCLLVLVASAFASPIDDFPFLNTTTSASPTSTQSTVPPVKIPVLAPLTTTFTNTNTEPPSFKPYLEASVLGFEDGSTPVARGSQILSSTPVLLISISIYIESSTTGFVNLTTTQPKPTPDPEADFPDFATLGTSDRLRPHLESTATGFGEPRITPPPVATTPPIITVGNRGDALRPVVVTSVIIDTVTLRPAGETAIIGVGVSATRIHLDPSGHPVVVIGGSSSTVQIPATIGGQELLPGGAPITIGSGFDVSTISINEAGETIAVVEGHAETLQLGTTQAFTFNGIPATAIANEYKYVIGSSTLSFGQPTTIDGTVVALTTDLSGSTVLINGDITTTIPALVPAPTLTLADTILDDLSTIVVSGTTKYLLNSQTLAPDHPITVDGTVILISTNSGTTVLMVGDKTTTLEGTTTQSSIFGGITPAATPGIVGNEQGKAKATSATAGAMKATKMYSAFVVVLCGTIGMGLGLELG